MRAACERNQGDRPRHGKCQRGITEAVTDFDIARSGVPPPGSGKGLYARASAPGVWTANGFPNNRAVMESFSVQEDRVERRRGGRAFAWQEPRRELQFCSESGSSEG